MSAGLRDLRRKRARVRNARAKAIARLRRADAALANAKADGTQGRPLTKLRTHLTRKRAVVTRLALSERVVLDAIDRELAAGGSSPIQDVAALDARFPVLLFPVRIETRFRRTTAPEATGPAGELLVRIYPDGILSDSHEPLLTPNETAAGQGYWRKTFAGIPEADAWATILTETSPQRAAWIVDQTKPTNFAASGTRTPTFRKTQWRPSGWSREAEAPLLPERWVVSAFRDGVRVYQVFTNPIREGLALTPGDELQTKAETVDLSGDGLIVSRRLSWVYDFEEAVKAGMAVRLPITAEDLARGFSSLLVLGVRTLTDPISQSSEIHRLFDAHRYSRGLAFVAQGEKTSNTEEGASSFPLADPGGAVSFISARGKPMARPNNDGGRFARALGVKATVAHHVHGADRDDQKGSAAMVEALWPATIGYFIEQMLPSVIAPEAAASIRNHALKWLRGRGHLPPFRVGPVPYGVLPVGALSRMDWEAGSDPDHRLAAALRRLRSVWVDAAASLPHVGRSSDTDRDLIEILAQDASAQSVQLRKAFGQDTIWNLFSYGGLDLSEWQSRRAAIVSGLLEAVGQTEWNARLLHLTFADDTHDFAGPLVEASPLSDTEPLAVNYISWLRTASPDQLRNQNPEELAKGSHALLFLMLRHGLLAAYHSAAQRLIAYAGKLDAEVVPEPELVAIIPTTKTAPSEAITPWLRFATKIKAITGDQSVGMFLADEKKPKQALPRAVKVILKELDQYRGSLKALEPLATAELQRLFTETLDVSSHRIDAWITSVFAERLEAMRSAEPLGSYVASYAWVEHLRPDAPADLVAVKTPRGSEQAVAASGSYLQAPSLLHGAAAAVLRSAHLARRADGQQPYAIDLSSRRTRSALAMIETVRESQPLGAALGYQFERGLHEGHPGRELDRYLDLFRGLYPLVANKAENSGDPTESVAARNVVDGLRLWEAWRAGAIPFGEEGLDPSVDERAAIESELRRLDDTIDAIGDLLLSESVFQILKGSSAGAAASLDSLAKGKRAPEPEVVATPRGGAVIHQRVALVLPTATLSGAWSALGISPRAAAAPELNAWLSALLGPPDEIGCTVHRQNVPPTLVTIAALGLQPVDLLALAGQVDTGGQGTGELDSRVAWRVNDLGSAPDPAFSIDYTSAAPGQIAIAAALELLASIQRLLGSARALAPRDLIRPEMGGRLAEADTMPDDLAARAGTARAALDVAIAALRGAKEMVEAAPDAPVALAALRDALIEAAAFGVVGAVPPIMHGDRDGLLARAKSTLAELTDRQQRAAAATDGAAMLAMLFGRSFPILPRFRPAAADIIQTSLATEPDLGELPDATVEFWLSGLARVREPLDMLHRLQLYARALGRPWPRARIVQLPLDGSASRWVGLDFDGGVRSRAGVVSLALLGDIPPAGGPWCGALIDSWPEIIPNAVEDTGIAFQYDAPGVQAPQCVLIAVPPVSEKNWSYELLEETLLDTLQLAKIRAVDLPSLGTLGQLLPTVLLAANSENATISTSFAGHVRDGPTIVPGGNA